MPVHFGKRTLLRTGIDLGRAPSKTVLVMATGRAIPKAAVDRAAEEALERGINVRMPDGKMRGPDYARNVTPKEES